MVASYINHFTVNTIFVPSLGVRDRVRHNYLLRDVLKFTASFLGIVINKQTQR